MPALLFVAYVAGRCRVGTCAYAAVPFRFANGATVVTISTPCHTTLTHAVNIK